MTFDDVVVVVVRVCLSSSLCVFVCVLLTTAMNNNKKKQLPPLSSHTSRTVSNLHSISYFSFTHPHTKKNHDPHQTRHRHARKTTSRRIPMGRTQ